MTVTMYAHHEVLDKEAMASGGPQEMRARMEERGHDVTETWYAADDMSSSLLVAEFGSSQDLLAHIEILEEFGYSEVVGTVFDLTTDIVGDLDDETRAAVSKYDFITVMAPVPHG
jgi:hypothetical protein